MFAITPRLALRPGWPEDAAALAEAIGHEVVASKLSRVPWPYGLADADAFLSATWASAGPRFVITERGQDRVIGTIGLHQRDGGPTLGYWLTPGVWGRGYATEAGRAVVALARDGLRLERLSSSWFVGNAASGNVLRKLGFVETGRIVGQPSLALGHEVEAVEMVLDLAGGRTEAMAIAA